MVLHISIGIGRALVRALSAAGATVIAVDREQSLLDALVAEVGLYGYRHWRI